MATRFLGDTALLTGRSLRHITPSPDTIITTTITPIAIMLVFVSVFGGAITTGSDSDVSYLLPGSLVITIASGISSTAFRLFTDLHSGSFERFQSLPIARSSCCGRTRGPPWSPTWSRWGRGRRRPGHGLPLRAGVLAWLAVAAILVLFTLALTWLAVIAGLSATSVDGAGAFAYPLSFLPFISSAFVVTATMPGPVRAFAENQPVTPIVNTIRDLYAQQPVGTDTWTALAWCVAILILAYALAMATYHRRIS
jgi:ABC-2 type transport system permease protein